MNFSRMASAMRSLRQYDASTDGRARGEKRRRTAQSLSWLATQRWRGEMAGAWGCRRSSLGRTMRGGCLAAGRARRSPQAAHLPRISTIITVKTRVCSYHCGTLVGRSYPRGRRTSSAGSSVAARGGCTSSILSACGTGRGRRPQHWCSCAARCRARHPRGRRRQGGCAMRARFVPGPRRVHAIARRRVHGASSHL